MSGGHAGSVQMLLNYKVDVDAKDLNNQTPLHECSVHGNIAVASLQLASGGKVNVKDQFQNSPLSLAENNGYTELVMLFKAHESRAIH